MKFLVLLVSVLLVATFSLSQVSPTGASEIVDPPPFKIINPSLCDGSTNQPSICYVDIDQTHRDNELVGPNGLITHIAQVLVWFSAVLAVILIIIAGLMFIFSQGNSESVGRARSTVLYAVIGLVVAISGQAVVSFVLGRL